MLSPCSYSSYAKEKEAGQEDRQMLQHSLKMVPKGVERRFSQLCGCGSWHDVVFIQPLACVPDALHVV